MHEASFRALHIVVNDDNEDTGARVKHLIRECGEEENDRMHPEMEDVETLTMPERRSKVDNVVLSYTEIESTIAVRVACMMEQMVA